MRTLKIQLIVFMVCAWAGVAHAVQAVTAAKEDKPAKPGISFPAVKAQTSISALDDSDLAPPAGKAPASQLHLPNMENNDKLWALLQYEAKYGKIEYTSLRRFGDYANTNLRAVKAVGFNLSRFNFKNSDLRGADFREADLRGANFSGADLREAVLLSAKTEGTLFSRRTLLPFSREVALKRGWKEVLR